MSKMQKRIVILGAGESGAGTAVLALKKGYDVFVSDKSEIAPHYRQMLESHGIAYESGCHSENQILDADEVMKSPGIPDKAPIVQKIRLQGIPVVSEIEFASRYTSAKLIAITGSNGKTTTTSLIYHMFKKAGVHVGLAGNIGKSFALQVATEQFDVYVLEISSFQLDDIHSFCPHIAVLTNITPDHLDRYDYKLENYAASKFRITENQSADNFFVYCADDPVTLSVMARQKIKAHILPFSIEKIFSEGAFTSNNQITIITNQQTISMEVNELGLVGKHNLYNSLAAGIVGSAYGLRKETIRESLSDFKSLEHRLESVMKVRGIEFINDSKATNVNSTWYALEAMTKPVIWIAGGVDKGNDYSVLEPLVKGKVKALICLGLDNTKLHSSFSRSVDVVVNTHNMTDAVRMAYQLGDPGDVVLLSPACASFDLFENYEDRGRKFKHQVSEL